MVVLDVNVVLAAHRGDHPHHAEVRSWFDRILAGDELFAVPMTVWASFLRLATNRRIFLVPTPRPAAFDFIDATRAQPHHLDIGPGQSHLGILRQLCDEADADGDLMPDAVLAALCVEHHGTVATLDRDFARFGSLRHVRPA